MFQTRVVLALLMSSLLACGTANVTPDAGDDDAGVSGGGDDGGDAGTDAGADAGTDAGSSLTATFRYTPRWSGVTAVAVVGGFGQANDWSRTTPFLALTDDGTGSFVGTATLPAGSYLYLFRVTGDSAAGSASFGRYALDPTLSAYAACPAGSPTYSARAANPCSQLTVPQGSPDSTYAVKGQVTYDGAGIPGYLVELEREEPGSHHFFANRVDSKANGSFTFDAPPGVYRLQVLHPSSLRQSDLARDPFTLQALRRSISTQVTVAAEPTQLPAVEMAYHGYAAMQPRDGGAQALPVTFQFPLAPSAMTARVSVYGGQDGGAVEVGDPWWSSPYASQTHAQFDGGFDSSHAEEPRVKAGERYYWGSWQQAEADGGVRWAGQTMVLPIVFQ